MFVKGAGQSGVQSEWIGTTCFRRLVQKDSCFDLEQVRYVLQSDRKYSSLNHLMFHLKGVVHTSSIVLTVFDRTYTFITDSKHSFRHFMMVLCVTEKYPLNYCHHVLRSSRCSGITSCVRISWWG